MVNSSLNWAILSASSHSSWLGLNVTKTSAHTWRCCRWRFRKCFQFRSFWITRPLSTRTRWKHHFTGPRLPSCDFSWRYNKAPFIYPLHLDTIGIFRPVVFACFFPAGNRGETFQFITGIFGITPIGDLFLVSFVVHEYQSDAYGIKSLMAGCETVSLGNLKSGSKRISGCSSM